jgi:myo-inositol-1(or 4)-monophosphatase
MTYGLIEPWCEARLTAASAIVREAGALALAHFRDPRLEVEQKGEQDYVTAVDRAVEGLIVEGLRRDFPADAFFGEEGGLQPGETEARALWVIDPIDGTTNYTRGLPLWCISVALVHDRKIAIGLIFNPVSDEFYSAVSGHGAFCNGRAIEVSGASQPQRARIGLGFSFRRPAALHLKAIERLLAARCEYARFGSGALGLAFVADGRFDGYWEPHINAWDVLAGICLVQEAGGWSNDFLADGGLLKGNMILACSPALKDFLCERLAA